MKFFPVWIRLTWKYFFLSVQGFSSSTRFSLIIFLTRMNPEKLKKLQAQAELVRIGGKGEYKFNHQHKLLLRQI